jgi:hypothetical protein
MAVTKPQPSLREAIVLAHKIAAMPESKIPAVMGEMMYKRELFRTVSALDDLISDHPEHRSTAVKALDKMRLWCGG